MKPKITILTLGVSNLQLSTKFYTDLGFDYQAEESNEQISFFLINDKTMRLALYPRDKFEEETGKDVEMSGNFPCTLAYNISSEKEVDEFLQFAESVGGRIIKPAQKVFWGGYSGYFQDPDNFFWEVAYNPFM